MAPSGAKYKGGVFTAPGSTGNFSVTGVGFQPQAVLFFGSNKTTEDSVVTGGVSSVMRGVMAWDDVSSSIKSWCFSIVPHDAVRWEQKPIVSCLNGSAATDYQATAVSFDSDGFTVNFTNVPGSTRKVHYVAIGDMDNSTADIYAGPNTTDVGWVPYSGLHIGGLDDTNIDPAGANAEASDWGHMITMGGASWPDGDTTALSRESMWVTAIDTPFSDQDLVEQAVGAGSAAWVGVGGHFIGPFLGSGSHEQYPSGSNTMFHQTDSNNQGHFHELDAYSSTGEVLPASTAPSSVTITSSVAGVETPALIIFYGVCGTPLGQIQGNTNAIALGFWTEDHQYCVAANGRDDSFFQSQQYAVCDNVSASGAHTAEVAGLGTPGATVTTVVDDVGPEKMVWHMFGPLIDDFIPQFYRVLPGGRIGTITVPPPPPREPTGTGGAGTIGSGTVVVLVSGYMLLEDGSKLILEDGTGFLKL